MTAASTIVRDPGGTSFLGGVAVDLVPVDALEQAGVPVRRVYSAGGGMMSTSLVAGGRYHVRFVDPANRGAFVELRNETAPLPASVNLANPTQVITTIVGTANLPGAIVQLRCASGPSCTGLDRSRPMAQGITGIDGSVTLAVPRP
jgi:hypothetical protein